MIARLRLQLRRDFYHWTFVLFLLLYLGFFAKSWFSVSGNIYDGDDCSYAGFVMSLANDFDVDLSNQDLFVKISPNPVTGKAQIGHPIGTSILLLPFYLAAKPVVLLVSLLRGMPFNEKDPLFFVVLCSAIIFYFYLGGFFLRRALRYFVNGLAADLAVIVSMWGTILPIYVFRRLIFSHVPEFFLLSLLVYVLTWYYRCPRVGINMSVVLGVLMGGNLVIRYGNFYLILFTMLSIFYLVRLKTLFRGSRLRNVIFYEFVFLSVTFLIFMISQGLVFNYIYGGPFVWFTQIFLGAEQACSGVVFAKAGAGIHFIWFFLKNFIQILFGRDWGLLYTMPSLFIGIVAFIFVSPFKFFNRKVPCCLANALIIAIPFAVVLRLGFQGDFYGYRYLLGLLPFSAFGFAWLMEKCLRRRRKITIILCLLFCLVNFFILLPFEFTQATTLLPETISPLGSPCWGNNNYVINGVKHYFVSEPRTLTGTFMRGYIGAYGFGALSLTGVDLSRYGRKVHKYFALDSYKKWIVLLYPPLAILLIFAAFYGLKRHR